MTVRGSTIVTGVSRGIGRVIAQDLAARGHHVIGLARTRPAAFEGTFAAVDFMDVAATAAVLAEITAAHQVLRLVNNAGVARIAPAEQATVADLDWMMGVNVRAPMQCIQAVLPAMTAERFGRIVNIGSRAAVGKEGRFVYGASKAAIVSMTRTLALETAGHGITVNCVQPGATETDMIRQSYPPGSDKRAAFTRTIPAGRFGQPEEIAAACAYLLSEEAGYTTGQTLYVCGGLSVGTAPF